MKLNDYEVLYFGWNEKTSTDSKRVHFNGRFNNIKKMVEQDVRGNRYFELGTGGAMIYSKGGKLLKFVY